MIIEDRVTLDYKKDNINISNYYYSDRELEKERNPIKC